MLRATILPASTCGIFFAPTEEETLRRGTGWVVGTLSLCVVAFSSFLFGAWGIPAAKCEKELLGYKVLASSIWTAKKKKRQSAGWLLNRNLFFAVLRARRVDLIPDSQTLSFCCRVTWHQGHGCSVTSVLRTHPIHEDCHHDLITSQKFGAIPCTCQGDFNISTERRQTYCEHRHSVHLFWVNSERTILRCVGCAIHISSVESWVTCAGTLPDVPVSSLPKEVASHLSQLRDFLWAQGNVLSPLAMQPGSWWYNLHRRSNPQELRNRRQFGKSSVALSKVHSKN